METTSSDWAAPTIEGVNALFPDALKSTAIRILKHHDTPRALHLLTNRRYDDETLWKVLQACAYWSHFPDRAPGSLFNRQLMVSAQQATGALYNILRHHHDGTGSSIASAARRLAPSLPELDDKTIMAGLLLLGEYFGIYGTPGKKRLDLRIPGLLRNLDRILLSGRKRTIQTDGVYESIALLRYACFGGRKAKPLTIKKEIERYHRRFPETYRNK